MKRLTRCLCERGFINPPIGQAVACDHFEKRAVALLIRKTQLSKAIVAEVELGEVALQIGFPAMLVHTNHAALEQFSIVPASTSDVL